MGNFKEKFYVNDNNARSYYNQSAYPHDSGDIKIDKFRLGSLLRHAKYNGEIISILACQLVIGEDINKILLVRTPTTGAWMERIDFSKTLHVEREYYFDQRQCVNYSGYHENFKERQSFEVEMKKKIRRGDVFDLIVIDGFHDYHVSLKDFELCFNCLGKNGILLSHDCAPVSPELAIPEFRLGPWCGCTYASLITYVASNPEIALTILDTDTGIGIARGYRTKPKTGWLNNPVLLDAEIQSRFLSLISSSEFRKAYHYFRNNSSSLANLRSIW